MSRSCWCDTFLQNQVTEGGRTSFDRSALPTVRQSFHVWAHSLWQINGVLPLQASSCRHTAMMMQCSLTARQRFNTMNMWNPANIQWFYLEGIRVKGGLLQIGSMLFRNSLRNYALLCIESELNTLRVVASTVHDSHLVFLWPSNPVSLSTINHLWIAKSPALPGHGGVCRNKYSEV